MKLSVQLKALFLFLVTLFSNLGVTLHMHHCFTCEKTEINIFSNHLQCHNHCMCAENATVCCSPITHNSNQYTESTCCLHEDICYLVPFETQVEKNQRVTPQVLFFFAKPVLPTLQIYSQQENATFLTKNNGPEPPPLPYPGTPIEIAFHCLRIFPDQG